MNQNQHRETARQIVASLSYEKLAAIGDELHCWRGKAGDLIPLDLLNRRIAETQAALEMVAAAAFTAGRDEAKAEDASIARNFKGGWSATFEDDGNQLARDPDGPWCLGSDIADVILAPSTGPTYEQRIRAEIAERVKALTYGAHDESQHDYKIGFEECRDDVLAAIERSEK